MERIVAVERLKGMVVVVEMVQKEACDVHHIDDAPVCVKACILYEVQVFARVGFVCIDNRSSKDIVLRKNLNGLCDCGIRPHGNTGHYLLRQAQNDGTSKRRAFADRNTLEKKVQRLLFCGIHWCI